MNKKEVIISARLDSSEFDRSIKTMKDKLSQIYAPAEMSQQIYQTRSRMAEMGLGRPPTEAEKRKYDNDTKIAMRETEKFLKEQVKEQDKIVKAYDNRIKQLEKLKKLEEEMLKTGKEDLQIKEKIKQHEESVIRLRDAALAKDRSINRAADIIASGGGGGGVGGGIRGLMDQFGGPARIAQGLGAGILTGVQAGRFYNDMPLVEAQGRAAMAGLGSSIMGAAASGRLGTETVFNPERMKALQEAQRFAELNKKLTIGQGVGGLLAGAGGIAAGAATGAALGSILPGIGTAVGGIMGGIGGAYMGLRAMGGMEGMAQSLGAAGIPVLSDYFQARQGAQIAERFRAMEEAEKAQSPLKKLTTEFYQNRYRSDLSFQRATGMSDAELRGPGGLIQQGAAPGAGFTDQDVMSAALQIMAAGGSTRTARESAITSNRLQRNFDLTNASQVLGIVGGRIGGGSQSDNAVIRLLAEGTKLGLDKSEFVQENRQFVQMAASIAAGAGVRSAEGFQQVGANLGAFVTDKTMGGMQSAVTAYQRFEQLTGEQGGPAREAMRLNMLAQSNPKMASLIQNNRVLAHSIANMSLSEFTPDNEIVKTAMIQTGMSFEELKKAKTQAAISSLDMTGILDKEVSKLKAMLDKNPGMSLRDTQGQLGQAMAAAKAVGIAQGMSTPEIEALIAGQLNLSESQMADFKAISEKAMGGPASTGRIGDITVAGDAAGLAAMSESVQKMSGDFNKAGEAASKMTAAFLDALLKFEAAVKAGDSMGIFNATKDLQQPQSGATGSW